MKDGVKLKVEGLDLVLNNLEELASEFQLKAGRSALRKVGKQMAEEIKERAPVDTGLLKSSIRAKGTKITSYGVRVSAGADYTKGGNAAHLIEYGHKQVFRKGFGQYVQTGTASSQPFVRPALYNNKNKYAQTLMEGVDLALGKLEKKAAKQGKRFKR